MFAHPRSCVFRRTRGEKLIQQSRRASGRERSRAQSDPAAAPGARHRLLPGASGGCRHGCPTTAPAAPPGPRTPPAACSAASRAARRRRILDARALIAQRPGQQPRHRIDHHQRRQLPAGQHVVADRQLAVDAQLDHPLIHALVPARHQQQPRQRRQLLRHAPGRSGSPCADRYIRGLPAGSRACAARIAASIGSGFSTMPGPPPYGRSSTVRCTSRVCARGSSVPTRQQAALHAPAPRCRTRSAPRIISRKQRDDLDLHGAFYSSSAGQSTTIGPRRQIHPAQVLRHRQHPVLAPSARPAPPSPAAPACRRSGSPYPAPRPRGCCTWQPDQVGAVVLALTGSAAAPRAPPRSPRRSSRAAASRSSTPSSRATSRSPCGLPLDHAARHALAAGRAAAPTAGTRAVPRAGRCTSRRASSP